jgi:hypothetical protein
MRHTQLHNPVKFHHAFRSAAHRLGFSGSQA